MESIFFTISIAVIAVVAFQLYNPDKYLIHWVSAPVALLLINVLIHEFISTSGAFVVWCVASVALLILYFLRYRHKESKKLIDHLKWIGVILLIGDPSSGS
jgi:hypothetical protein